MNKEERLNSIKILEEKANAFDIILDLSETVLTYRPFPDAWTVKEQIAHCLDVDIANFHRYRRGITDPGIEAQPLNPKWIQKLNYQGIDIHICVKLIKLLRKFISDHFRSIIDDDWNEYNYIFGNEKKEIINLEGTLKLYIDHVDFHMELINRNIDLFKDTIK